MYPYYPESVPVGSYWLSRIWNSVFKCVNMYPDMTQRVDRRYEMLSYGDDTYHMFTDDDMSYYEFEEIDEKDLPLHLLATCGE